MRIGAMTFTWPESGGAYMYETMLLDGLARIHAGGGHDISYVMFGCPASALSRIQTGDVTVRGLPATSLYSPYPLSNLMRLGFKSRDTVGLFDTPLGPDAAMLTFGQYNALVPDLPDWLFLGYPSNVGVVSGRPFIMPIHDLQHRLQPHFPEVAAGGEFETREFMYRNACRAATLVMVDSEVGKEDVLACYGDLIEPDRIAVLPFASATGIARIEDPAALADARARHNLPERFFFYPAQFWPHKNHLRIVEALADIASAGGEKMSIVFTGSGGEPLRDGVMAEVKQVIARSGLEGYVHFLGHLSDRDVTLLYCQAVALVMPTYFGPTNIPVCEAWAFDCPVITSDIRGVHEQAGDAALLVDPGSSQSIGRAMLTLWTDEGKRIDLIHRGRKRAAAYTQSDFHNRVAEITDDVCRRVADGRVPEVEGFV
jgi:glycosyltransferase involved in cell wall biosynthesis